MFLRNFPLDIQILYVRLEFVAYDKITVASPKHVLSLDKIDMSPNGIIHMNILDFLLHKKDLILT